MTDGAAPQNVTLDGQLVVWWEREAARFDDLEKRASFKWMARSYARRAARARQQAETSRVRESARGRDTGSA